MTGITIRLAERADAARLDAALRGLSQTMGDTHRAAAQVLSQAVFGEVPACHAMIVETEGNVVGVALFSPLFSTVRGMSGAYVSDLWVDAPRRGKRLGPLLLAAVRDHAKAQWGAGFLRLAVYADNPRAVAFYERIGFTAMQDDIQMTLEGIALSEVGRES